LPRRHADPVHPASSAGQASLESALEENTMIFDYSLAGVVSAGLLIYLTYALLRPERF
jgi:K+-transporting ATPase KdpF subunit